MFGVSMQLPRIVVGADGLVGVIVGEDEDDVRRVPIAAPSVAAARIAPSASRADKTDSGFVTSIAFSPVQGIDLFLARCILTADDGTVLPAHRGCRRRRLTRDHAADEPDRVKQMKAEMRCLHKEINEPAVKKP